MPLNCSTFVTQKEQLKCQAARDRIPNYFNIILSNGTITIKYNDREFIKN